MRWGIQWWLLFNVVVTTSSGCWARSNRVPALRSFLVIGNWQRGVARQERSKIPSGLSQSWMALNGHVDRAKLSICLCMGMHWESHRPEGVHYLKFRLQNQRVIQIEMLCTCYKGGYPSIHVPSLSYQQRAGASAPIYHKEIQIPVHIRS